MAVNLINGTVLYGMMGSGKSTLGGELATHLGQPFVDTDALIERTVGASCKELIDEGTFPGVQMGVVMAHEPTIPEVIATGGSVPMYDRIVRHLRRFGPSIFINVDPEALEARLSPERIAALNNPRQLSFRGLCEARAVSYRTVSDATLEVGPGETAGETFARLTALRASL